MKITTNVRSFVLEEVYDNVQFITKDNEIFAICMRDTGFEFNYDGIWYEAKNDVVRILGGQLVLEDEKSEQISILKAKIRELEILDAENSGLLEEAHADAEDLVSALQRISRGDEPYITMQMIADAALSAHEQSIARDALAVHEDLGGTA